MTRITSANDIAQHHHVTTQIFDAETGEVAPGGSTPTLADVLTAGNETGGHRIQGTDDGAITGAFVQVGEPGAGVGGSLFLAAGDSDVGTTGAPTTISAGSEGSYTFDPAALTLNGASALGHGKARLHTDGGDGTTAQFLGSDGSGDVVWREPPTLAEVLVAGNDPGGTTITAADDPVVPGGLTINAGVITGASGGPATMKVLGGDSTVGGTALFQGGDHPDGDFYGAIVYALGGEVAAMGRIRVYTNDNFGSAGQLLGSDGAGAVIWREPPTLAEVLVAGNDGGGASVHSVDEFHATDSANFANASNLLVSAGSNSSTGFAGLTTIRGGNSAIAGGAGSLDLFSGEDSGGASVASYFAAEPSPDGVTAGRVQIFTGGTQAYTGGVLSGDPLGGIGAVWTGLISPVSGPPVVFGSFFHVDADDGNALYIWDGTAYRGPYRIT